MKQYTFWSNTRFHFCEMLKREPLSAAFFVITLPLGVFLPLLNARLPKLVLQGLEEGWELSAYLGSLILLILVLIAASAAKTGLDSYLRIMNGPFEDIYNQILVDKRLAVDYETAESREFNEEAYAVYDSLYRNKSEMKDSFLIWQRFLVALGSSALYGSILWMQSPLVCLLVLLPTVTAFILQKKAHAFDQRLRLPAQASNRKMAYVEQRSTDLKAGKDIRLFDLSGWFLDILHKERNASEDYVNRWEGAYLAANCVNAILCFLRDGCAYVFLILRIVSGSMAVSDFVWYMAVAAGCQQACASFLEQGELLGKLNQDYVRLRSFLDKWNHTFFRGTCRNTQKRAVEIEFRHVTFQYPESSRPSLEDLSFRIRAGEKIALAGLNGAGKTTLVKLLCGLYQPTLGEILIDGRNVAEYDRESYYKMISAVFQNTTLLPLSIADNISAAPEQERSLSKLKECLALAGIREKVDSLPSGENTSLGKGIIENAADLSGGERQKLWMARALYKDAPILILDEPTAALDPLAEQEIYEKYMEMAQERTSLFISHRLSGTRFCDRILFLENGRITQQGSHQKLLEEGGAYARLFQMQSQYYTGQEKEAAL
ncbi:MAG: ABC transporter ATP-binding protein/permease [Lachnospiraceae bacterium]|nr:ABC transporter ATP-binding protein/permease [Lachnospiraceae bacterium]